MVTRPCIESCTSRSYHPIPPWCTPQKIARLHAQLGAASFFSLRSRGDASFLEALSSPAELEARVRCSFDLSPKLHAFTPPPDELRWSEVVYSPLASMALTDCSAIPFVCARGTYIRVVLLLFVSVILFSPTSTWGGFSLVLS